jgi:hypothetical protein
MTDDEVNEVLTAVAATCETQAIGTRAIGTRAIGTQAIGTRAIKTAGERACASP